MEKILSEKTITIQPQGDIQLAALLFEELAALYHIPSITVDQIRLILLSILGSINNDETQHQQKNDIALTFKLFDQGSISIKLLHKGLYFNPFQKSLTATHDFKLDTFSLHLSRKYMSIYTYHRVLDYNVIYLKKE
ncbi:MAG: hypothetical protein AB8E82_14175 [Aureispira sp.]